MLAWRPMRIIAGDFKGHGLRAPAGRATRPTADAVREALFNILGPPPEDARVLDLYAGSGALGLEALSRGAALAVFVEQDPRACQTIGANLRALGLSTGAAGPRAQILRAPVERLLSTRRDLVGPFHWIFADPPYADGALPALLDALAGAPGLLHPAAVVVVEHPRKPARPQDAPQDAHGPGPGQGARLRRTDLRCYGQTALSFYSPEP